VNSRTQALTALLGATLMLSWSSLRAGTQPPVADLVLVNGRIITVDAQDSIAEAVAISAGRIVAIGRSADIRARVGAVTEVIDLGGRAVTPGLIDTHVHFR
jgi:predicted amidohydrolase YtcJ